MAKKKVKYVKVFGNDDEEKAKALAKKIDGCVKKKTNVYSGRKYGYNVGVPADTFYVYPKKHCKRKK